MRIRVNGRDVDFRHSTVIDLIKEYRLKSDRIVVEKNGAIVPPDRYRTEILREGDIVELIRFVGGG